MRYDALSVHLVGEILTRDAAFFMLQLPEQKKAVVAQALGQLPSSVKLWVKAMSLEEELTAKRRVLKKGEKINVFVTSDSPAYSLPIPGLFSLSDNYDQ